MTYTIYYAKKLGGKQEIWSAGVDEESVAHQVLSMLKDGKAVSVRVETDEVVHSSTRFDIKVSELQASILMELCDNVSGGPHMGEIKAMGTMLGALDPDVVNDLTR